MEPIETDFYPRGTSRHHLQDKITCPLTGTETVGFACVMTCPSAVERGDCHWHCAEADEADATHQRGKNNV
jgi:hypothetical protein